MERKFMASSVNGTYMEREWKVKRLVLEQLKVPLDYREALKNVGFSNN